MVDHPQHYQHGGIEVIEMMRRIWGKDAVILFCQMNAFKYRQRMGYKHDNLKSAVEDLEKAMWYEEHANVLQSNPDL